MAQGEAVAPLDDTLTTLWMQLPDGSRRFRVLLWNGADFDVVIDDLLPAPPTQ